MLANHKGQEGYLAVRANFNLRIEVSNIMHAAKFLYLNRHGYNSMCRYNRRGEFNIPFGKVDAPYFPEKEIRAFAEKAKHAVFLCCDFTESIEWPRPAMSFTAIRHTYLRRRPQALPITTRKP